MCSGVAVGEAGMARNSTRTGAIPAPLSHLLPAGGNKCDINTVAGREPRIPAAESAGGRAALAADWRENAAGRAGGELLVPPPPRRLRVDRGAGEGEAGRRHG